MVWTIVSCIPPRRFASVCGAATAPARGQNRAIRGTSITISSSIKTSRAVGMATTATLDPIV